MTIYGITVISAMFGIIFTTGKCIYIYIYIYIYIFISVLTSLKMKYWILRDVSYKPKGTI